jgi:hypothetical protein
MKPDITLSTGRVIVHTPYHNGATMATPSTGPVEMTDAEWAEYVEIIRAKAAS